MKNVPIYVFRCVNGHEVEEMMTVAEGEKPMPCVQCNERDGSIVEMKRVPSSFSGKVLGGTPTFYPGRTQKGTK